MRKPSFPCTIIKVTDCGYGLSLCHIVSHLSNRIHIQKVLLSLIGAWLHWKKETSWKHNDLVIINVFLISLLFETHTSSNPFLLPLPLSAIRKQNRPWGIDTACLLTVTYVIDRQMLENRFSPLPHLSFTPVCSCMDQIVEDVSQMLDCLLTTLGYPTLQLIDWHLLKNKLRSAKLMAECCTL